MKFVIFAAGAALLAAAPAQAKVVFTGYGDLRYDGGANASVSGSPATLANFGLAPGRLTSRGFTADAIGLFATTQVQEDLTFQMDLDFRQIGNTVGSIQMPYAFLDWTPYAETTLRGGRVTIPFNYFNENRFYSFQREELTAPVFQSSILGLPIADWGVAGRQDAPFNHFTLEADAYVVNGYGSAQGQKDALRLPSLPGGITLVSNLRSADNNHKPAVGGRLQATKLAGAQAEVGVSGYWGDWDSSGLEPMQLLGAHAHFLLHGVDFLAEALRLGVRGDQGFAANVGDPNWHTDGYFTAVSYEDLKVRGKTLAPYLQWEFYRSKPDDGGANREVLRALTAGAALHVSPQLTAKAEYLHFSYELPFASGPLKLGVDGAQLAAVVTF